MKRIGFSFTLMFALVVVLASCGSSKIPEWANQDEAAIQAQEIITMFNQYDYDGVASLFNNPEVTGDQFSNNLDEVLRSYGSFEGFGKSTLISGQLEDGTDYITLSQITNYENGEATFDISFYEDGTLAGFYMWE